MVRHNRAPGDLDLSTARTELGYWVRGRYPAPGTSGWPEPAGRYTASWRAAFLSRDSDRAERLASAADHVLGALQVSTARTARYDALTYRLHTYGSWGTALADAAPTISITMPVPVADPRAYQGIDGLTVVPDTA
ncbi:hypothetical protein [Streptomyces sp. NPDC058374]|uniref:hypothetical protein n=1 Tax=Streptomyces sp. NPDC058374 TaxID=3346466 RepID=UPI0036461FC9